MKTLFIGGTGQISTACAPRAIELGHDIALLNRGTSSIRPVPQDARVRRVDPHADQLIDRLIESQTRAMSYSPVPRVDAGPGTG
jgi:nucleoside-diphosphate-sugar epimerase